jgi:dihydrofolate reductase
MTRLRLPSISYIVARSTPENVIGCENKLPWHLRSDLKRFKETTSNHVIIMGRLTHESIGKVLPNRTSIVLTREPTFDPRNSFWNLNDTALIWANTRETALFFADIITIQKQQTEFFVIGGSYMFEMFKDLFNRIYLTEVIANDIKGADAFFDYKFDGRKWKTIHEEKIEAGPHDEFATNYCILERKYKKVRYVEVEDYLTDDESKKRWLSEKLVLAKSALKNPDKKFQLQYKMFSEEDS